MALLTDEEEIVKSWNELQQFIDLELDHNFYELQKMVEIYERVGMEKQASEIRQSIRNSEPVRISTQNRLHAA